MTPTIPAFLWFKWGVQLLLQIPLRLAALFAAPMAVALQKDPNDKVWPWLFPFDHAMTGKPPEMVEGEPNQDPSTHADPMYWRWIHTDLRLTNSDGTPQDEDRSLLVRLIKHFGVNDCAHWSARLVQLWRNGGAGANYAWFGADVRDTLMFDFDLDNGGKLTLAYHQNDTFFGDTGREIAPDAVPEAFYLRVGARRFGWKLNYKVHGLCKWMLR